MTRYIESNLELSIVNKCGKLLLLLLFTVNNMLYSAFCNYIFVTKNKYRKFVARVKFIKCANNNINSTTFHSSCDLFIIVEIV